MNKQWYVTWFESSWYRELYSHRTIDEAKTAVSLVETMNLPKGSRILDLCCGAGRHAAALAEQGFITITADAAFQGASGGYPRNTDKPANRIEDIYTMADYISQVLVPTEKVVTVRDGKKIAKDKVYFPGYIMIEANLTGEIPHIIKSIPGVIGFLGETKGGDAVPLRQSEVNRMLGKVDELSVQVDTVAIPFTIGETIKVIDGPFNGFNGTIEKINEEKRKLEVMVKIFGRKTPLELSFMQVEKV